MKVILLKNVPKLGKKYEVKDVSRGHAQNMLIPQGDAMVATPASLKNIEKQRSESLVHQKVREDLLIKNIEDMKGTVVKIIGKANDKGHLFAGIHAAEIIPAVKEQTRLDIDEEHLLIEEPLKEVGKHKVRVKVGEVESEFTVEVVAE